MPRKKSGRFLFLIAASVLILVCSVVGTMMFLPSSNETPQSGTPQSGAQQSGMQQSETQQSGAQQPPVPIPVYVLKLVTTPKSNISLTFPDGSSRAFLSDQDGNLAIPDLRAGNYAVGISRDGYTPLSHKVDLNGNVEVELPLKAVVKPLEKDRIFLIGVDTDYSRVLEKEMERVFGTEKVAYQVSEGLNGYEEQLDEIVGSEPSAVVLFLEGAVSNYGSFFTRHADKLKKKNIPFAFVLMPEGEDDSNTSKYNIAVLDLMQRYDFTLIQAEDLSSDMESFKTEHGL